MTFDLDRTKPSLVARTVWRIEARLADPSSLAELAAMEGVSPFHLTRAFTLVTGRSLMAYVRARRLSEAARQLHNTEESVLNIALDAGYQSHEGFARAFRDMFGASPTAARAALPPDLQECFKMTSDATAMPDARIVEYPGLRIVGRARRFSLDERPRIPAFWEEVIEEIGQYMWGNDTFGVSFDFEDDEAMTYMVAFADDGRCDSSQLDHLELVPGRYAVFDHAGHISTIAQTWAGIFDGGLARAGTEPRGGPEFETYTKDFRPEASGGVSIWIPVK